MHMLFAPLRDRVYLIGLVFIVISLSVFCFPFVIPGRNDRALALFFICFVCDVAYFIALMERGWRDLKNKSLLLILLLISAYALNREMDVFDSMAPWFAALQVLVCMNFVLFAFFDALPAWLKHICCFLLGVAFLVFAYLAIYLFPLYAISLAALVALGISLHAFVPLFFCLLIIYIMKKVAATARKYWIGFSAGILIPLAGMTTFVICWSHYEGKMNAAFKQASFDNDNEVPAWIAVARAVPLNMLTTKILSSEHTYTVTDHYTGIRIWNTPMRNFGERLHDPLIMTATAFCGNVRIPEEDCINILKCLSDSRHETQERLWSGNGLVTEQVSGSVLLWPQQRISYTELELIITQTNNHSWMPGEAIYTFYLPEGGVVSSLSLWVNGKEEQGILTTKAKADSAYRTIVGVESRDPSVVHWQEGNTVSVRVFPVSRKESRKFKIGVTAPMSLRNEQLIYENVHFEGPSAASATQQITIHAAGKKYERKGRYQADWQFSLPAQEVVPASFSFNNSTYTVYPYKKEVLGIAASVVYLDVNASWSRSELKAVYELVKDRPVFVAGKRQVTAKDLDKLYDEMSGYTFSLFPFHEIEDDAATLVVSKSNSISPSMDDLRESPFMKSLQGYFTQGHKVKVFNLGGDLSPYLKSLKEFRSLQYLHGDLQQLRQLLKTGVYTIGKESNDLVTIDNAQITIARTNGELPVAGPDHIMRLFAYNHILQQSGAGLLQGAVIEPALVEEAEKAHVVTPVSSLVVLETQADYERFNIQDSENGLRNASEKSNGAVPEPHEWALIIFVGITLLLMFKYRPAWIGL